MKRTKEQNLIPQAHVLTVEEQSSGGVSSGVTRRRIASLKGAAKEYVRANPDTPHAVVAALVERITNTGDPKAIHELADLLGESVPREELAFKKKQAKGQAVRTVREYGGIPAAVVAPAFAAALIDIEEHAHSEYIFPGGRGSAKSSFVSVEVVDNLMRHEDMHAVVLRQVSNTLKDSVYSQILWAIDKLGLSEEWEATKSPLEITRKRTGQKIFFRGADDEGKIKSIKPPFGYIGVLWFEELDQFRGEAADR